MKMKRILSLFLALSLACTALVFHVSAVHPATVPILETLGKNAELLNLDVIFEDGISAPPHVGYTDAKADSTDFILFHSEEYMKAKFAYRYAAMYRDYWDYGINDWCFTSGNNHIQGYVAYVQVDAKVDGGEWQYTSAWDQNNFEGTDMLAKTGPAFAVQLDKPTAENWKNSTDDFAVFTTGAYDFANHTVEFRYRYVVQYTYQSWFETVYVVGDWSDTWSVGQNGTQTAPEAYTTLPTPVVTDAVIYMGSNPAGHGVIAATIDLGEDFYDIVIYETITNGYASADFTFTEFGFYVDGAPYGWNKHDGARFSGGFVAFEPVNCTEISIGYENVTADNLTFDIALARKSNQGTPLSASSAKVKVCVGGHTYGDWTEVTPATENETGLDKHVCTQCGREETRVTPALGHQCKNHLTPVEAADATCVDTGLLAHYVCSCGKYYADANAETETTLEQVTVPATGTHTDEDGDFVCDDCEINLADYVATLTGPAMDVTVGDKVTFTVNVDKTFASGKVTLSYDKTLLTPVAGEGIKIGDGTVTVVVYGEDKTSIDVAFTANAAGTAAVALVEAAFSTKEEAASEDLTAAAVDTTAATVVIAPAEFAVTLPEIFEGNSAVANGSDYTFKAKDTNNYNYALPTATVGGEAVTVIDNGDGTYTVKNVTGALVIAGTRTEKTYNATVTGNGAEDVTLPEAKPTYGTDYVLTLPVTNEDYTYTVTVQVGNGEPIPVTSNTYTVAGADITGDIVVNVTKTEIVPETVTVTLAGNANDAVVNFVGTVNKGDAYTLTINPVKGYTYTVTATMGGETVTLDTSVTNAYTVAAATADIEFTVTATLDKSGVSVNTYVQLDGTTMWLVTVDTELADGKTYTYGGNVMYYSEAYGAYVYLVVARDLTADTAKAAVDATTGTAASFATDVAYDVNKSGKLDANDAQLVYNMYNAVYSDFTADVTLEKFLLADANADGMLNTEDAVAIVKAILN